ncbi:M57 family metalloprotease [Xanthovirga aplysinae]|uniref:M57 family metalloprotease n=1 Tax=Xanthovirga aplysinae TaxID=2529853 RepID=UPI0012BC532A|nr:M57 family metalloprotease [Xanthovirga aplysinae]MTI29804.1 protease B [Xanthovirga aplysinae]
MKIFFKLFSALLIALSMATGFYACNTPEEEVTTVDEVSPEILAKLDALGFNTVDFPVVKHEDQLIIENDISLNVHELDNIAQGIQQPVDEHYSTHNLVDGTPRTINVYVNSRFLQKYRDATDEAIRRYNEVDGFSLTFKRVTNASQADIQINPSPWWYYWQDILGSAGFPTTAGDPYNQILMTREYYDGVTNINGLATTIAHEMGHCIGFRHTDYMDRDFSCNRGFDPERVDPEGANHIPGTPTEAEAGSWMLACGSANLDRPFTTSDITALSTLY